MLRTLSPSPAGGRRNRTGALSELGRSAAAIPALVMVGVFVALAAADGGYFPTAFLPAGLVALALLVTALVSVSTRAPLPRMVVAAVALLGAFAAWSYLSILWAGDQGAAWEAANRALIYAVVFGQFALWPLRPWAAAAILAAFGLGIAALGAMTLIRATGAEASEMLVSGRFFEPVGYVNGNVGLWLLALLPSVFLAARREVWPPLRGLALGGAGLLAGLALLGQSRGSLVALPLALVAFVAIVPGRARSGVVLLALAAATLLALDPILKVFSGTEDGLGPAPLVDAAARAVLLMAAALALLGTLAAFADRGVELSHAAARHTRRGTAAALAVVLAVGAAVGFVSAGDPVAKASDAWADFTAGSEPGEKPSGSTRLTSAAGGNRYDFWRVAVDEFAGNPLAGTGAGNFQSAYLREGESVERPRFPHSLELGILSQTGIVGTLFFAGGVMAALLGGARAVRRTTGLRAAAAGTALTAFLYWALHGSVDWFYELPALAAPAFAMLGLAAALAPRGRAAAADGSEVRPLVGGRTRVAALAAAALAAFAVLGAPWLAQRHVEGALVAWDSDPDAAFESLRRAGDLNPLSVEPHATAAAIALRLERTETAREEFEAVLERDPHDAYATLQLGALASEQGRRDDALGLLRRASALSPRDALIDEALAALRAGERLDASEVYDSILERRRALTGD